MLDINTLHCIIGSVVQKEIAVAKTKSRARIAPPRKRRIKKKLPVWDFNTPVVKDREEAMRLLEKANRKIEALYRNELRKKRGIPVDFVFDF